MKLNLLVLFFATLLISFILQMPIGEAAPLSEDIHFSQEQYNMLIRCSQKGDISEWSNWVQQQTKNKASPPARILLQGADFHKANLKGVNLSGANLKGANFYGADLTDAAFDDSNLEGTNFSCAILSKALFYGSNHNEANFYSADLTQTKFYRSDIITF